MMIEISFKLETYLDKLARGCEYANLVCLKIIGFTFNYFLGCIILKGIDTSVFFTMLVSQMKVSLYACFSSLPWGKS